jgi:hypothetical protein
MSDHLLSEELHRIAELPRLCKALIGTDPHTLIRWGLKGVKTSSGTVAKLEMVRIGSVWKSSIAAVSRFIQATNTTPEPAAAGVRSPAQRKKDAARAGKHLAARGL